MREEAKDSANDTTLIIPELNYLLTPENATPEKVLEMLKQSGHSFFFRC